MAKPFETWTVLPHGKLTAVDDNLLTVVGQLHLPIGEFPRRMTVVRLRDGRLVLYSAIALDDDEMAQLERWGTPAFLIVPNNLHRMDAHIFKTRYPQLVVLAPAGAKDKIAEVVPVDACEADFGDEDVELVTAAGTDAGELLLVVRSRAGVTLVVNDLIWNLDRQPGFGGLLLQAMGGTGPAPKMPGFVKLRAVDDKAALAGQLEGFAALHPTRIIVSHGDIITADPEAALHTLAAQLAA